MSKREATRTEAEEEQAIRVLLGTIGAKVYCLSQTRATQQSPGLPDLWAFVPTAGGIAGVWIEVKRQRGFVVRPEQVVFRLLCKLSNIEHIIGGQAEVEAWAVRHGVLEVTPVGGWSIPAGTTSRLPLMLQVFGLLWHDVAFAFRSERKGVVVARKHRPR